MLLLLSTAAAPPPHLTICLFDHQPRPTSNQRLGDPQRRTGRLRAAHSDRSDDPHHAEEADQRAATIMLAAIMTALGSAADDKRDATTRR